MNTSILETVLFRLLKPYHQTASHWNLRQIVKQAVKEASRETSYLDSFTDELRQRIVRFEYRKNDGSLREAWGTLSDAIIAHKNKTPKAFSKRGAAPGCVTYFDLERNDWRCFLVENFVREIN